MGASWVLPSVTSLTGRSVCILFGWKTSITEQLELLNCNKELMTQFSVTHLRVQIEM